VTSGAREQRASGGTVLQTVAPWIEYRRVKVEDHYAPTEAQLEEAVQFIRAHADRGMDVYVHCHAGRARSATAVLAYLVDQGRSRGDALAHVEQARTISGRWNHGDLESLRAYAAHLDRPELGTPDDRLPPHTPGSADGRGQSARTIRTLTPARRGTAGMIRAAGGVIPRAGEGGETEVLVVHRPQWDDWTFPKGKVEAGEMDETCALREIEEETGLQCALGRELPSTAYVDHKGRRKIVRYWVMKVVGGEAGPRNEVDAVRWVRVGAAAGLLSYERDRALLASLGSRPSRVARRGP
jgi:8-oxo-dGTP diphosphatase